MHCVVGRLGLFLYGFLFGFEAFFRWFVVLILHWFNHEESTLLTAMFAAPRGSAHGAVDRRGGRPLAEWLPAGKGSRRLRRGNNGGDDVVRVKEG
ncbi:hypothetical protein BHM03_00020352 [Ensete ventricosum]|nr:hypothetical protein BHM03_00020352 [Ensete ventricosum]